jgi:hypothetical protein
MFSSPRLPQTDHDGAGFSTHAPSQPAFQLTRATDPIFIQNDCATTSPRAQCRSLRAEMAFVREWARAESDCLAQELAGLQDKWDKLEGDFLSIEEWLASVLPWGERGELLQQLRALLVERARHVEARGTLKLALPLLENEMRLVDAEVRAKEAQVSELRVRVSALPPKTSQVARLGGSKMAWLSALLCGRMGSDQSYAQAECVDRKVRGCCRLVSAACGPCVSSCVA